MNAVKKFESSVIKIVEDKKRLLKNYFRFMSRSIPSSNVVGCGGQPGT